MEEGTVGIVVFSLIAIASAFFWHKKEELARKANIKATITAVILFQVAAYIHLGHLDPFFPIAMVITGMVAFFVSAILGKLIR